jgi:hypothetical protein
MFLFLECLEKGPTVLLDLHPTRVFKQDNGGSWIGQAMERLKQRADDLHKSNIIFYLQRNQGVMLAIRGWMTGVNVGTYEEINPPSGATRKAPCPIEQLKFPALFGVQPYTCRADCGEMAPGKYYK